MCAWGTYETVLCPAGFNGNNLDRVEIQVDACIVDLVGAFNKAGILTLDSCCGHGKGDGIIRLVDGRKVIIKNERCEK